MKLKLIVIACSLLAACFTHAQKHDYNYYTTGSVDPRNYGVHFQYVDSLNDIVLDTFNIDGRISFSPVMSDQEGVFLFYFNSMHIYDSLGRTAINGDSMYHGSYLEQRYGLFPPSRGLGVGNDVQFIPVSDSLYFMFSLAKEQPGSPNYNVDIQEKGFRLNGYSEGLWFTAIRLTQDGRVKILESEKKLNLLDQQIGLEQLISIKKENGEDWWMMVPELLTDSIFLFSIDVSEEALVYEGKRYFSPFNARVCAGEFIGIHPKGEYIVRLFNQQVEELNHIIEIFAFDRCTGQTDRLFVDSLPIGDISDSPSGDVEFSENGRFLYVALSEYILQYDMMDDNPLENRDTIGYIIIEGDRRLSTNMDQLWRLPNGKILSCGIVSTSYAHYIHNPNEKGDACNFENKALIMPTDPLFPQGNLLLTTLPTYPPYRMPPLDYDCETSVDESEYQSDVFVSLYPNPAWIETTVQIHGAEIRRARMLDINGQQVLKTEGHGRFDVSTLPGGVYFVEVETQRGVFVRKLVIR